MPNGQLLHLQPTLAQNSQVPVPHILAACAYEDDSHRSVAYFTRWQRHAIVGRLAHCCPGSCAIEHVVHYAALQCLTSAAWQTLQYA